MNVFSDNGRFFVRILPGDRKKPKVRAQGEFFSRQDDSSYRMTAKVMLNNPVAPIDALVSNDGTLIIFDNWCNRGYGKAIVVYRADGTVVSSYTLEELYERHRLARIRLSSTQRHWRCYPPQFVDTRKQTKVRVRETLGGYFVIDLPSGTVSYRPNEYMIGECPR